MYILLLVSGLLGFFCVFASSSMRVSRVLCVCYFVSPGHVCFFPSQSHGYFPVGVCLHVSLTCSLVPLLVFHPCLFSLSCVCVCVFAYSCPSVSSCVRADPCLVCIVSCLLPMSCYPWFVPPVFPRVSTFPNHLHVNVSCPFPFVPCEITCSSSPVFQVSWFSLHAGVFSFLLVNAQSPFAFVLYFHATTINSSAFV